MRGAEILFLWNKNHDNKRNLFKHTYYSFTYYLLVSMKLLKHEIKKQLNSYF